MDHSVCGNFSEVAWKLRVLDPVRFGAPKIRFWPSFERVTILISLKNTVFKLFVKNLWFFMNSWDFSTRNHFHKEYFSWIALPRARFGTKNHGWNHTFRALAHPKIIFQIVFENCFFILKRFGKKWKFSMFWAHFTSLGDTFRIFSALFAPDSTFLNYWNLNLHC